MNALEYPDMLFVDHDGVHVVIATTGDAPVRLLHVGSKPFDPDRVAERDRWAYRLVELRIVGEDHDYIAAGRYAGSGVGGRLRYVSHASQRTESAHRIEVVQHDPVSGLRTISELVIRDGVIESRTSVENDGPLPVVLQSVSSFFLVGAVEACGPARSVETAVHVPRSGWYAEFQWTCHLASDLGLNNRFAFGSRHETVHSVGSWCSANFLPMGFLENVTTGEGLLWEILHGGSWNWQIGETANALYLHVAGPTEEHGSWWLTLAPGERYDAVPVAVAPAPSFDLAMAAMSRHRRSSRLVPDDGGPVVFNDYMNCLMGDPTEAKILPLVDVAADLGAEVYCIDSGWYARPGDRWSFALGKWEVDGTRFPRGLEPVISRIRERGMIPGIWFEIEAMTGNCPGFSELPDDWFFVRHGSRVVSHRRYQLDFRNPAVRAFADAAIDRAVGELGFGFLKLDYNFSSGPGSDLRAESPGQSLIDYERAFLGWLDAVRARYPALMLEHCASGGQRLGRPYLDRTHNASNSDEGDPLQVARIAAAGTTIILPEQNGTWALPDPKYDDEMTAFAMLCAIPYRMLLSGGSNGLSPAQASLVADGVEVHKAIRRDLGDAVPSWPLGLPNYYDPWICAALRTHQSIYVALWRRDGGPSSIDVRVTGALRGRVLYPASLTTNWSFGNDRLSVSLPERSGRLFQFDVLS
jgi:alpha-galactosidase